MPPLGFGNGIDRPSCKRCGTRMMLALYRQKGAGANRRWRFSRTCAGFVQLIALVTMAADKYRMYKMAAVKVRLYILRPSMPRGFSGSIIRTVRARGAPRTRIVQLARLL